VLRRLEVARWLGVPPTTEARAFLTPGPARRALVVAEHELARLPRPADLDRVFGALSSRFPSISLEKKGARRLAALEPWEGGTYTGASEG
jgi:hypothetical protein